MSDLNEFLARHPELRDVDPETLREALRDRVSFDRLMSGPPPLLSDDEQRRVAAIRARLLAPRGSFLATARGWLALRFDRLTQLAAGVAFAGSTEFFVRVLAQAASGASVMRGTPLGVDLIDPDSGAMSSTDECTISTLEPWGVTSAAGGGVRLRGSVAFDFVFEESTAQRFEGGVAIACFLANDGIDARCLRAPVTRAGTRLLANFDELLPGVARLPESGRFALRYRLLPPGEAAKALLEA